MRKIILFVMLSFMFVSCSETNTGTSKCSESKNCSNGYYCEIDKCIKSMCSDINTDKYNNPCALAEHCNLFTGLCDKPIECNVNGLVKNQVCGFNNKGMGE